MSAADGFSRDADPGDDSHDAGVWRGGQTCDPPTDLGVELRHAVQAAAVVGIQTPAGDAGRRESGPTHKDASQVGGLRGEATGSDNVGFDESRAQRGDPYPGT